jgi:hypothetical protein
MPIAWQFNPDLVLVSAGFDAAIRDPLVCHQFLLIGSEGYCHFRIQAPPDQEGEPCVRSMPLANIVCFDHWTIGRMSSHTSRLRHYDTNANCAGWWEGGNRSRGLLKSEAEIGTRT